MAVVPRRGATYAVRRGVTVTTGKCASANQICIVISFCKRQHSDRLKHYECPKVWVRKIGHSKTLRSGNKDRSVPDTAISKDILWVDDDPKMHSISADQRDTYTIGDLSREFDVTLRTLRFYESKTLLAPQRSGQSRVYSAQDRSRLALILRGKQLGFTLGEIREMIAISEGRAAIGTLNLTREKCFEQISHLEHRKREIEAALAELRRIYSSIYAVSANSNGSDL